jgi:hypothetical protein
VIDRPLEARVQRLFFRRLQHRQPQSVPLHITGDGFKQRLVVADPSADRGRVKEVGAVVAIDNEPVLFGHDIEKKIEINKTLRIGVARNRKPLEVEILLEPLQIELCFDQRKPVDLAWHVEHPDKGAECITLVIGRIEKQPLGFTGGFKEAGAL